MAGESKIAVADSGTKNVHTWQRSINAVNVEEDVAIIGEPYLASYSAFYQSVATATAGSHMAQLMAGASLNVRIRHIKATQVTGPAAVTAMVFQIVRLTTAGTGGTVTTPSKKDNGDAAAGATSMALPTVKGTEGVIILEEGLQMGTLAVPTSRQIFEWTQAPNTKPIIIPAGTTNGICFKNSAGLATATMSIYIEFDESSFVA